MASGLLAVRRQPYNKFRPHVADASPGRKRDKQNNTSTTANHIINKSSAAERKARMEPDACEVPKVLVSRSPGRLWDWAFLESIMTDGLQLINKVISAIANRTHPPARMYETMGGA